MYAREYWISRRWNLDRRLMQERRQSTRIQRGNHAYGASMLWFSLVFELARIHKVRARSRWVAIDLPRIESVTLPALQSPPKKIMRYSLQHPRSLVVTLMKWACSKTFLTGTLLTSLMATPCIYYNTTVRVSDVTYTWAVRKRERKLSQGCSE